MATLRIPYHSTATHTRNEIGLLFAGAGRPTSSPYPLFITAGAIGGAANTLGYQPKINIYKGTVPTFADLGANISTRSADLLITLTGANAGAIGAVNTISGVTYWRVTVPTNASATVASASGTATWFVMTASGSSGALSTNPAMLGTVGATGSGADLEIANTSIVSGQSYSTSVIYLNFPVEWTV